MDRVRNATLFHRVPNHPLKEIKTQSYKQSKRVVVMLNQRRLLLLESTSFLHCFFLHKTIYGA